MDTLVWGYTISMRSMRNILLIGGGVLLALAMFIGVHLPAQRQGPTLSMGDKVIWLELADTDEKQALGLGGREAIGDDEGMLFVFPQSDAYGVWMKDMRFPLDIIWLEPSSTDEHQLVVLDMRESVAIETYPVVFYPSAPALYVLELKGGFAQKNGMHVGSVLDLKE